MANERLWTKERITYFWNKIKNLVSTTASGKVDKVDGKGLSTNDYTDNDQTAVQTTLPNRIAAIENAKGANGGYAELDSSGKVPSAQLPSFVDDVLEYASLGNFPLTGESGKIYVALDTNKTYRWSGSAYVEISESLALGETSATAYRGDRGKEAYDHASDANKIASAQTAGFYKIGITGEGHVASAAAVTKSDITGLGIPAQDTTYSAMTGATSSASGASGLVPQPSAGDEGKVLYGDGTWKTPAAEVSDMVGATSSANGEHGLVPAPSAGDQYKVLLGSGNWEESPGAKLILVSGTVTNESGAYSGTFNDDRVTPQTKPILLEISNRSVFRDTITVTPGNGYITVACSNVVGTSAFKVSLQKVLADPTAVTSTEFDILDNRITALINHITSGAEADAGYHLGFYLDENGDLCQVDTDEEEGA